MFNRAKASGVKVTPNYIILSLSAYNPDNDQVDWGNLPSGEGAVRTTLDGQPGLLWQRPNTYTASGRQARKGMSRKVHLAVRYALDIPPRAYGQRQYFLHFKAFRKTQRRYPELELYLLTRPRPWGQFWEVTPAMK